MGNIEGEVEVEVEDEDTNRIQEEEEDQDIIMINVEEEEEEEVIIRGLEDNSQVAEDKGMLKHREVKQKVVEKNLKIRLITNKNNKIINKIRVFGNKNYWNRNHKM